MYVYAACCIVLDIQSACSNEVFISAHSLLMILYNRDCRRSFTPPTHWLVRSDCFYYYHLCVARCTPLPFGRICFVVLVMRKGGESSWSDPRLVGCTSEVSFSMCTATRTSLYSPVGPRVCFCIFSLGLCFACLFVLCDLFVSPFFCVSLGS